MHHQKDLERCIDLVKEIFKIGHEETIKAMQTTLEVYVPHAKRLKAAEPPCSSKKPLLRLITKKAG